ncbi:MAG: bifunctional 4'-phosphopantothenoylcysteine decarboxylase/phosphopantothenoylcysteine synthetase, partial [Methylococcaceae bacterium]|nr:bifunctional 4'-phosphopantothenoylcysteine decarboxylase/phosphopantothenoylcysteine synthetase [Methylococcaceae bacterium]
LVSGPVSLPKPNLDAIVEVQTAAEMYSAVMERARTSDIYIGAAAVADYAPVDADIQKIKKNDPSLMLSLERTPDILASVAAMNPGPFTVGFAAETESLENNAKKKLESKNLDMIVANQVGGREGGFESDQNALTVLWKDGQVRFELAPKKQLAHKLVELIAERLQYSRNPRNE